ncbi:MAG: hypothetical protein KF779_02635 [Hyphomonadaceae bacterium]|nr:hypothetical protein [Hyphomonadaceae bacterium]
MPNLVGWTDVVTEDINVPEGVAFNPIDVNGTRVMEISAVPETAQSAQKTGGVSVRMSDDFENRVSGNQLLVTVRAYSTQPEARLGVAYSTNEVGNSGWRVFPVTDQPADYQFVYSVAPKRAGLGDFLGFRSYGEQAIRVVGFQVTVLPGAAAAPLPRTEPPPSALRTTQGE